MADALGSAQEETTPRWRYGRPVRRWCACMIDGLILLPILVVLAAAGSSLSSSGSAFRSSSGATPLLYVGLYLVAWIYESALTSSRLEGTVGKWLVGLRVTDEAGQRLSFGIASLRFIVKAISNWILLPYLYIFFNDRCRTFHDLSAGSVVTRRR